ncbi:hypothetical protein F5X68DRAFT_236432 [Plectosphaerella plurivora]|uniref:Uncharacterized protein n=1 Tax=Plectosphaerella plurivora TaxID=936078 RepID=A0A9P8V2P0_9PEZI|nr:hypothetical protein F5X68DRAFT_236432 [Plectosphaerella plurivora]
MSAVYGPMAIDTVEEMQMAIDTAGEKSDVMMLDTAEEMEDVMMLDAPEEMEDVVMLDAPEMNATGFSRNPFTASLERKNYFKSASRTNNPFTNALAYMAGNPFSTASANKTANPFAGAQHQTRKQVAAAGQASYPFSTASANPFLGEKAARKQQAAGARQARNPFSTSTASANPFLGEKAARKQFAEASQARNPFSAGATQAHNPFSAGAVQARNRFSTSTIQAASVHHHGPDCSAHQHYNEQYKFVCCSDAMDIDTPRETTKFARRDRKLACRRMAQLEQEKSLNSAVPQISIDEYITPPSSEDGLDLIL